jgi:hypothetical protein
VGTAVVEGAARPRSAAPDPDEHRPGDTLAGAASRTTDVGSPHARGNLAPHCRRRGSWTFNFIAFNAADEGAVRIHRSGATALRVRTSSTRSLSTTLNSRSSAIQ